MKWLVFILGPNHHANEVKKQLISDNKNKNVNIIIFMIVNKGTDVLEPGPATDPKQLFNSKKNMASAKGSSFAPKTVNSKYSSKPDKVIYDLNEFCRQTPEGYMVTVENSTFDGQAINYAQVSNQIKSNFGAQSNVYGGGNDDVKSMISGVTGFTGAVQPSILKGAHARSVTG